MRRSIFLLTLLAAALFLHTNADARNIQTTTAAGAFVQTAAAGRVSVIDKGPNADQPNATGLELLPALNQQVPLFVDLVAWYAPTLGISILPFGNAELFLSFPYGEAGELYTSYGAVDVRHNGKNGPAGKIPNPDDGGPHVIIYEAGEPSVQKLSPLSQE